jgi:hypothetical protein
MTDLFTEAARDVQAEQIAQRCALAKVSVADFWPFLALAQGTEEFEHRLALAQERIAARVDPDMLDFTLGALKDDFAELQAFRQSEPQTQVHTAAVAAVEPALPVQPGEQIWHVGRQQWMTVTAGQESGLPHQPDTRHNQYGNPSYFENAAEEGPNTFQTGQYPQFAAGPDPVDPLNSMFPMQPSQWTVPPNAGWVERPMQLQPGAGSHQGSLSVHSVVSQVLASAGYVDDGVQTGPGPNPGFFSGGSEGIGGDPQNGYPEDLAVEDPDSRVNELYGAVPPQPSSGSAQGGAQPYSNPGVARQGARRLQLSKGDNVRVSQAFTDPDSAHVAHGKPFQVPAGFVGPVSHTTGPDADSKRWVALRHPDAEGGFVYADPSNLRRMPQKTSVRHTAPGGGEHAPYKIEKGDGGYYVVNAKGERKNSEPKSEDEARQYQKALYANVPGAAESAKEAVFFDPADGHVRVVAQGPEVGDTGGGSASPQPPQSMMPGGVGSIAQEPLGGGPAGNPMDPSGADAASKAQMPMMGSQNILLDYQAFARMAAENIRQRPSDLNPSGLSDEYDDVTWEGGANTRPRQPTQDRGVNTPQTPRDPIPQTTSADRALSEDEERLRRATRVATQRVLAGAR